jgi:ADP-ribosylglycohydrolase
MKEKILGGILGVCVGDALGVPVEFVSRESLRHDPVTGMRGYGTHSQAPGTWSDDSSMTLCLLDSLTSGLDYTDIMQRFVSWMYEGQYTPHGEVFDIGGITKKALFHFGGGTEPLLCGGRSEYDNGNGSLMRILPLVFHLHSRCGYPPSHPADTHEERERGRDAFFGMIHDVSSLTHAHPRSHIACGIYLCIAGSLIVGSVPSAVGAGIHEAKTYYEKREEYAEELRHFKRICGNAAIRDFANLPQEAITSSGYVVDTLEAALWCLLNTTSYESCVLQAVNLGGDTDTVAAVAGGLAGLAYGPDAIPEAWKRQLARREYIEELCSAFYVSLCAYGAEKLRSYGI